MLSIPQTSLKPERFRSYVEELRQFASTYGMRCGEPDNLRGFAASLEGDTDFRDECSSMLRAIVYRERGKAPLSELLTLVAAAWGGPNVEAATDSLQEPIRHILRFVSGLMNTAREGERRSGDAPPSSAAESAPQLEPVATATALMVESDTRLKTIDVEMIAPTIIEPSIIDDVKAIADDEEPLSALDRIHLAIAKLERESDDVIRYVQLLRQRAGAEELRRDAAAAQVLPYLALRTKLLSQPIGDASRLDQAVAPEPYDPWKQDSDLQKELRRFKAERDARLAEERAARKAASLRVKLLRRTEVVVRRVMGADNFLRRSLYRQNL